MGRIKFALYIINVLIYAAMHEPLFKYYNFFGLDVSTDEWEWIGFFHTRPIVWEIKYLQRKSETGGLELFL
jgi:hypothetical protein